MTLKPLLIVSLVWLDSGYAATVVHPHPQEKCGHLIVSSQKPFAELMSETMDIMHCGMMAAKVDGKADHDFLTMMIPHHQGAIDMAKIELLYGTDPEVRALAQEIITDQQAEIDRMQAWLNQHSHGVN